jgi:transcription elongation factor GreA
MNQEKTMAQRKLSLSRPSYSLTPQGRNRLLSRRDELEAKRGDILEQITMLSRQQSSDPVDLASDMRILDQIDAELTRIDGILRNAVLCASSADGTVALGTKVTLLGRDKQLEVVLVESVEADPLNGFVSNASPLGRRLLGKRLHEQVTVETPAGETVYEILSIT